MSKLGNIIDALSHKRSGQTDISSLAKRYGYEPYVGGAGPTEEHTERNNMALKQVLERLGYKPTIEMFDEDGAMDPIQVLRVGDFLVSYDRWGFVFDRVPSGVDADDYDQASLVAVVALIQHNMPTDKVIGWEHWRLGQGKFVIDIDEVSTEQVQQLLDAGVDVANLMKPGGDVPFFHLMATKGNLPMVKFLVEHGTDPNMLDSEGGWGNTALFYAATTAKIPVIEYLLSQGADINAGYDVPLVAALGRRDYSTAKYLLDHGANPNPQNLEEGYDGDIPIISACEGEDKSGIALLLKYGADPNAKDNWGWTSLHKVAAGNAVDVAALLLKHGANPNVKNSSGNTPLQVAKNFGRSKEMIQLLRSMPYWRLGQMIREAQELSPDFFDEDNKLLPEVRKVLLKVTDDVLANLAEREHNITPTFIVLTGSLTGPDWDEYSDIDLHLGVDFGEFEDESLARDFLLYYAKEFNSRNYDLKDHHIELYFQDDKEPHLAPGLYDIQNDKWLKYPKEERYEIPETVAKEAQGILDEVENFIKRYRKEKPIPTPFLEDLREYWQDIREKRKTGLEEGLHGHGNLVFKALRRNGALKKLLDLIRQVQDDVYETNHRKGQARKRMEQDIDSETQWRIRQLKKQEKEVREQHHKEESDHAGDDSGDIKEAQSSDRYPNWHYFLAKNKEIYEQVRNQPHQEFLDRLPRLQEIATLLADLYYQVYNNGFLGWIINGYASSFDRTVAALKEIGTPAALQVIEIIKPIRRYVKQGAPSVGYRGDYWKQDPYDKYTNNIKKSIEKVLDKADDDFYAIDEQFVQEVDKWFEQQKLHPEHWRLGQQFVRWHIHETKNKPVHPGRWC